MARPPRPRPVAGQRARARAQDAAPVPDTAPTADPVNEKKSGWRVPTARRTAAEPEPETTPPKVETEDRTTAPVRPSSAGSGPGRTVIAGVLALLLVSLAVLGAVAYRIHTDNQVEAARDQAQGAARNHVVDILSYDYRHLDADFARGRDALTGKFADDYAETTSEVIRPSAEQYQAVVKAEVAKSSVVSGTANRVVVLMFVNQTTTSTRLDGPKVDLNRVRLTMNKVDGQWLVSDVDAL
jgi:Mce-associated membrane protein